MKIKVKLFATLRDGRGKEMIMDLPNETTVRNIINEINISEEEVAILLINGRDGDLDKSLQDEDVVSIFPPVGGG